MQLYLFLKSIRILILYFVLVALAHIETGNFNRQATFLSLLPYLTLAFCTINLTMPGKKRYLTTVWLLSIAVASYIIPTERRLPQWTSSFFVTSFGKIAYLLTFADCIKRIWNSFIILLSIYYVSLIWYCFADIFYSIPAYVILISLNLALDCGMVGAASAVYKFGSKCKTYSKQAALIRFIGTLFPLLCSSIIMINEFAERIRIFTDYIILLEYVASSLMFLANKLAF